MLTPNKLITRLSALLEQVNAENNLYKVKSKVRQIPSFVSAQKRYQKSLQQLNEVVIIMGDNKLAITAELKTFHFDLPKDAGINLKHDET